MRVTSVLKLAAAQLLVVILRMDSMCETIDPRRKTHINLLG